MFEQEIGDLQNSLESMDLSGLNGTNVKRDEIVERWAR